MSGKTGKKRGLPRSVSEVQIGPVGSSIMNCFLLRIAAGTDWARQIGLFLQFDYVENRPLEG